MTQPTNPIPPIPPTPPIDPPESPTETEVKLDTTPQNYYQAIGWLRGKLVQVEERFQIQVKDFLFPLYLPRKVIAVANNHIDQMVWIKCYPQSKGEGLSFKGVWMGTEQAEKGEPGIFVLRGVWQFIPQCRRPVFTIYRNELKDYENRPSNQHLPLIWADQPPYRFRKDSEEKPKFYQITARLIPQRACFGFVSQIADPQDFTPKRVKKPPMEAGTGSTPTKTSNAEKTSTLTEKPRSKPKEKAPVPVEIKAESQPTVESIPEPESTLNLVPESTVNTESISEPESTVNAEPKPEPKSTPEPESKSTPKSKTKSKATPESGS